MLASGSIERQILNRRIHDLLGLLKNRFKIMIQKSLISFEFDIVQALDTGPLTIECP